MLPRVLSGIGILLILLALAGFLYGSLPQAASRSGDFLLGEGDEPGSMNPGNLNANTNQNATPTPRPSPTPISTPTPRPTPQPPRTPTPTPQPTPEPPRTPTPTPEPQQDEALRSRVEEQLKRRGLDERQLRRLGMDGVKVFVSDGRVTLVGEVPDGMLDEVTAAAKAAGALSVENRVRAVRRLDPVPHVNANTRRGDAPAEPTRPPPPELLFEVRADVPEQSKIEVEWPESLGLNDTRTIRITIINEVAPSSTAVTDIPGNRAERLDPHACYPKNTSLRKAYPDYEATATAKLVASNFDAQLSGDETKSLDADRVTWQWNVKPKSGGSHTVLLSVTAQWRHKQRPLTKPSCEIFGRSFKVSVEEKWLSEGSLKTAQTVVGLLGLFLQLPIFVWWRKRGKADKKKGQEDEEKEEEKEEKD
jgi:hypothetical protein